MDNSICRTTEINYIINPLSLLLPTISNSRQRSNKIKDKMKKYLIEREIPNAGKLTDTDLTQISQKSCAVLDEMGSSNIQWLHSYVTEDKVYCIYKARNKALLKEHAEKGGFPANKITLMSTIISPKTAEKEHNKP